MKFCSNLALRRLVLSLLACVGAAVCAEVPGITLGDDRYEARLLDTDESVFFLSQTMDLSGRLFVGCREALFVYEPDGTGFGPRQELYRFPKDSWLYDLEVYGDDLFVLCNTALYRIRGAVTKREGLKPEKLLWGLPQGHYHQGMHGMEFGPTGDLFLSMGDPQPHMHWDRTRPDHLWHWTFFVGPENKEVSYTGVGAVFRYRLRDHALTVHASGLRNTCGISFDPQWRLFANDNDQEGAVASPGKLVYAPRHSWHSWVRGWAARHNPARRDVLPVVNLELDVPVGQCWHEGALLVANWGNRTVSRHRIEGLAAPRDVFLQGEGQRRPVSVTALNDGRLVVSVCYMQGNEGSPVRQTDLLLLTPKSTTAGGWAMRYKRHQDILRKGGDDLAQAAKRFLRSPQLDAIDSSLIYLAAVHGDAQSIARIQALAETGEELAIRAMAEFPAKFAKLDVGPLLAQPKLRHAALEYLHAVGDLPPVELAADDDAFVRQSAAQLLARRASVEQLTKWAANDSAVIRQAAVNAAGVHIWEAIESTRNFPVHREAARSSHIAFEHPIGPIKLEKPVFIFMPSAWWKENQESVAAYATILKKALADPVAEVRIPAAVQLFFLRDPVVDERALAILAEAGIDLGAKSKASQNARAEKKALRALKSAKLASDGSIPAEFANQDWSSGGNAATGKTLFTSRGCVACHLAPDDGKGGSIGPSLVDVHTRFSAQYLAESILLPNRFVSPNFHPTTLTMKDGAAHTGFVEKDGDTVELRMVTGTVMTLSPAEIAKRETSHQSLMPAGLVQTPDEMRHLLAYMLKRDALSTWQTSGNWQVDAEGGFVLTPRPGETDWKRYGDYLWSKKQYQHFECEFEFKFEKGGNSGFYFNVSDRDKAVGSVIEVQIKDSYGETKLDAHGISGGILPGVAAGANAVKAPGQWNHMAVKSLNGAVTVTLNGVLVNQVSLTHPKLKDKPKQGYFGFQDHGLPFGLRNITLRELAGAGVAAFNPVKANVYRFPPQQARFMRVELLGGTRAQPCIDEFEIFGPDSSENLALAGKASASSLLKGFAHKHQIAFLNDGKYGNARSWIPAKKTGWAQIKLAKSTVIDRVVLSRDRTGKLRERAPVNFDIRVSTDGKAWKTVKKLRAGKVVAARSKQALPNIVLIMADDFGWGDTSCNNPDSPLKTPAIDRIAQEGIRLTNAQTPSAVCTPTRYGLLTGRYPWRSYLKSQVLAYYAPAMIPKGRTTIASYLKTQGYRTGGFGKWHLGLDWTPKAGDPADWRSQWNTRDLKTAIAVQNGIDHSKPFQNAPTDVGFDSYFGTASNCSRLPFFIEDNRVFGAPKPDKIGQLRDPACARTKVDDIYVERAIGFMKASTEQPFFVYLPLNAIHGAVQVPKRFAGKTNMSQREDKILWANESVGKILDALDRMGVTDDTLVIFTTDNGPTSSAVARRKGHQPTGPYRGLKTNIWDGGTRVPFLARWPGRIKAGSTSGQLVGLTDVLATVAAVCGTPLGEDEGPDSHNALPVLLQSESVRERPALVTASYEGFLAIRQGKWKGIFGTKWTGGHYGNVYGGAPPKGTPPDGPDVGQLFDIASDPYEKNDLWKQQPEVVATLRKKLAAIQKEDQAPLLRTRAARPNVVLIMADDMGYSDLPTFGKSEIPTPALNRLAREGTMFTSAYVTAPICVASRMGLLTGQNQQRFGIYGNIYGPDKTRLFLKQTLMPAVFQQAGYRTAHVGKWHLSGNKRLQYDTAGPRERGFDESLAIRGGDSAFWKGTPVFRNGVEEPAAEYLTDLWGTEACDFIDRAHAHPFFLYLAYNAVHSPMHALEDDRATFPTVEDENRRTYDGMLLAMDRSIGRVLDRLDKHGIADNTIVVFLNDNGGGGSSDLYAGHSRNYANNKPLRGHKFDVLEGGVRVPMIMRWPKQVPAGKVYHEMTSSTDLYPTVVAAAGLQMPKGQPADGVDLLPFIKGNTQSKPHEWLCWQNRAWLQRAGKGTVMPTPKVHNSAIRKGNWKLVRLAEKIDADTPPPAWQLYDLSTDVGEEKDIAAEHTEVVGELDALFGKWRSSMHPTVE